MYTPLASEPDFTQLVQPSSAQRQASAVGQRRVELRATIGRFRGANGNGAPGRMPLSAGYSE
jgi:hypothetical protein